MSYKLNIDPNTEGPVDLAIATYLQLRDEVDTRKKAFADEIKPMQDDMHKLEEALYKHLFKTGQESTRTRSGTAYQTEKVTVSAEDWDAFLDFVVESESWHMLDRKPNKTAINEYLDAEEELPPGIKRSVFNTANIRRSK